MYQKLRSLLVAACLVPAALIPSAALAASSLESVPSSPAAPTTLAQNTYSPEFLQGYMDVCVSGLVSRSASRESAISYCQCFIDRAQLIYTQDQLSQLALNNSGGALPPEIIEIGSACSSLLN